MKYLFFIWKNFYRSIAIFCAFLLFGLSVVSPSWAQIPKECGNPTIDIEALKKAEIYESGQVNKLLAPAPMLIRVYFHICRNNDGTNAGATVTQINNEFNRLVSDYAGSNVCFANMGLNFIDNTNANTNIKSGSDKTLLTPFLVPNCLNIFYHASLYAGGTAYAIPNTFCSVAKGNIGFQGTISHEIGHCMGLIHTHETVNGLEKIDGSNCSAAGDKVCDTPADPYNFRGSACFTNTRCLYTGNCQDPNGATNYSPPYNNMMSYWDQVSCNRNVFTSGQYTRINSFLNTNSGLQACESASSATVTNLNVSSGYYFASTVNDLIANGSINMTGTVKSTFAGATVLLGPNFRASPATGGLTLVRGTSCNFSASAVMAKANSDTIKNPEIIERNVPALLAYPNPASSEVRLVFNLTKNEKNTLLKIYDMNGKKVNEITLGYLSAGKQTVKLNLFSLSDGIYYVYIQLNTGRLATKIVLAR